MMPPEGGYMEAETSEDGLDDLREAGLNPRPFTDEESAAFNAADAELAGLSAQDYADAMLALQEQLQGGPGERLLAKLGGWLEQQPEWLLLMALPRQQRREAARLVADHVMNLPSGAGGPGRADLRKRSHVIRHDVIAPKLRAIKARQRRIEAKQERDRIRYKRLSMRRIEELARRENERRDRVRAAAVAAALLEEQEKEEEAPE